MALLRKTTDRRRRCAMIAGFARSGAEHLHSPKPLSLPYSTLLTEPSCTSRMSGYAPSRLLRPSVAVLGCEWIRTKQFLPVRLGGRRRQEEQRFPRGTGCPLKISSLRSSSGLRCSPRPEWNASSHGTGDAGRWLLAGKCTGESIIMLDWRLED